MKTKLEKKIDASIEVGYSCLLMLIGDSILLRFLFLDSGPNGVDVLLYDIKKNYLFDHVTTPV